MFGLKGKTRGDRVQYLRPRLSYDTEGGKPSQTTLKYPICAGPDVPHFGQCVAQALATARLSAASLTQA